jgi:hypothetical protein
MQPFQQSLLDARASHTPPAPPTPLHRQNQMGQSPGLTHLAFDKSLQYSVLQLFAKKLTTFLKNLSEIC